MNIQKIMTFLQEHPGYIKKGANQVRNILAKKGIYVSNEEVSKAQKAFRNLVKGSKRASEIQEILKQKDIKSVWTLPNGDIGWSVRPEKENKELIEFKDSFLKTLRELKPKEDKKFKTTNNNLLELSLPDFHFGKVDGLTIEEQADKFLDAVKQLFNKAQLYNIDKVLLPIGNDFFNTDSINYTTTKGTPQRDNSSWQESFRVGWRVVIEAINYISQFLPIDVLIVQGNHDYTKSFYLGEVLEAYYSKTEHINIINDINSPRKYYQYGNVLLGFTHGDKEKITDLPLLMATEAKDMWSVTKYREWHIGHLHKHMHDEYQGVAVKTLPSLVGQDEWHKLMGYTVTKKAQSYIWNKEKGLEGYIQINQC